MYTSDVAGHGGHSGGHCFKTCESKEIAFLCSGSNRHDKFNPVSACTLIDPRTLYFHSALARIELSIKPEPDKLSERVHPG